MEPVSLPADEPLEMIAGDAGGGAFLLVGDGENRPVLYVGSEGEGGLRAEDLLASLHAAAADERYRPISDRGDRYRPMVRTSGEETSNPAAAATISVPPSTAGRVHEEDQSIPGQLELF